MDSIHKKQLEITATKVRMGIIEGVYNEQDTGAKAFRIREDSRGVQFSDDAGSGGKSAVG